MKLLVSTKALLLAGLLCSGLPNYVLAEDTNPTTAVKLNVEQDLPESIQAEEVDTPKVVELNIEQESTELKENKASFNMTAFCAALACNTAVAAVTALPAMLLHAMLHVSEYKTYADVLVSRSIHPFSEECRDLFKTSFPRYYSFLDSIDCVGNYVHLGLAIKMGMETESTTSIKEICLRSLKNVRPYALCASALTCVGALF